MNRRPPDGDLCRDPDAEIMSKERAEELSEYFDHIKRRTIGNGVVRGIVHDIDWSPNAGALAVEVDVPAEDEAERFFFDRPADWSSDWEFVRWVRSYGYDSGNLRAMIADGVSVRVRHSDSGYELIIPEQEEATPALRERVRNRINAGILGLPRDMLNVLTYLSVWSITGLLSANYLLVDKVLDSPPGPAAVLWTLVALFFIAVGALLGVGSIIILFGSENSD